MQLKLIFGLIYLTLVDLIVAERQTTLSNAESFKKYTDQSLLWGPYKSNLYYGMRPRYVDDTPFMMGLMWFDNSKADALSRLRHNAEQNDNLEKYGWEVYDPRLGGKQIFLDRANNLNLTIYLVKSEDGKNWVTRVKGEPIDASLNSTSSIILYLDQYIGKRGASSLDRLVDDDINFLKFKGKSEELGKYRVIVKDNYGTYYTDKTLPSMEIAPGADCSKTSYSSLQVPDAEMWQAHDIYQTLLSDSVAKILEDRGDSDIDHRYNPSILTLRNIHNFKGGNFHFIQKTFNNEPFEFDIIYNSVDSKQQIKKSSVISAMIDTTISEINSRFDKHFNIVDNAKKAFAKETLSNLLGGIGYFYGSQIIDRITKLDENQFEELKLNNGVEEGPYRLFTSVPSRGFFPRGFYWDEGFQILQIMDYDSDLAFELMSSWFNLIDQDGWIAREVILGPEARSRVPDEFIVQSPNIANPPTLLLAFSEMLKRAIEKSEHDLEFKRGSTNDIGNSQYDDTSRLESSPELLLTYAKSIYPKLIRHFEWFRNSQRGLIEEYDELLDGNQILEKVHRKNVYKWLGRTVSHCLPSGLDDYPRAEVPDIAELHVDALSWVGIMARSMKQIAYIMKLENDEKRFEIIENEIIENLNLLHWSDKYSCFCDVTIDEEFDEDLEQVCHQGYISLLPFALKLIPQHSPKLDKIVSLMSDPKKLYSEYGLLSLSRDNQYFGTDENYWRGKIWMNINYLCLDALRFYYPEVISSNEKSTASLLYRNLKNNLIDNVYKNWLSTGYVYENYDPNDGHGTGAQQFTGWTALVVNLLGRF